MVMYLKEVDSMLALVCLTREENFVKKGLVDYNISVFKEGLQQVVLVNGGGARRVKERVEESALGGHGLA